MSFSSLGLHSSLVTALAALGFETPTAVQVASIPQALAGHDLLVSSQTGSGKTAAFMLPSLHRLYAGAPAKAPAADDQVDRSAKTAARGATNNNRGSRGPRILVLTPTRELALQVEKATRDYAQGQRLATACLVGGMPYGKQLQQLSRPVDVVIATPGRLKDHLERGRIDFSRLEVLVLDEADRMLDMGFAEDIDAIVALTPADRQTLLFSATLDGVVGKLAQRLTRNAQRIDIAPAAAQQLQIEQRAHFADDMRHKEKLLDHLLRDTDVKQVLVFTATKRSAEELTQSLTLQGFAAGALHGDMRQHQRNRTLQGLRDGRTRIVVATDVAARGIDVPGISHVINFDAPRQAEDYVHRIGRTGRAGRTGIAITLLAHNERYMMRTLERHTGASMSVSVIPGLEPTRTSSSRPSGARFGNSRPGGPGRPAAGRPSTGRTDSWKKTGSSTTRRRFTD
jgi:superfamily II DNA/RNA helicase